MAARPGIQLTVTTPADGGESPNRYDPNVSAHIRVYWPPLATEDQIIWTLAEAFDQARQEIYNRMQN